MSNIVSEHDSDRDSHGEAPLLSLRGISKDFGPVQALRGINLDVYAGKVTALCGDNGAGKSSLIKVISGIWQQSGGDLIWNGETVEILSLIHICAELQWPEECCRCWRPQSQST